MNRDHLTVGEIDEMLDRLKYDKHEPTKYGQSNKEAIKDITTKIDNASKQVEEIFSSLMHGDALAISRLEEEIMPVIKQAAEIPHIYHLFYELHRMEDYVFRHTIGVGIIALMLGKWLKLPEEELSELALGATLHDIGKTRIDPFILNKPGKLTKDEYEEIQLHTIYGYELLRKIDELSDRVALIALQHHEREDGKGYPKGLVSNQIDPYSKIVAVADVFHAMLSTRVYQEASPFYVAMRQLQDDCFGKLDPNIVLVFLYKLMDSITGRTVMLSDGRIGKIIMVYPYDPLRSLVQVGETLIDLRHNRELNVEKVINDE